MKCKKCKQLIPSGSVYCMFCGAKLIKDSNEITVPEPRRLPSGNWSAQLMINGKRQSVTGKTKAEYYSLARKYKNGEIKIVENKDKVTLSQAIDEYIDFKQSKENERNRLSPETVRGYRVIQKRFPDLMKKQVCSFDMKSLAVAYETAQDMVSAETKKPFSEKTLHNSFGLIIKVIDFKTGNHIRLDFDKVEKPEKEFLEPEQIEVFCKAIKGKRIEIPALLALHSLRRSEIMGLTWNDIDLDRGEIYVHQTRVYDEKHHLVEKTVTKTSGSTRKTPIVIEQLSEAIRVALPDVQDKSEYIVKCAPNTVYRGINSICEEMNLQKLGVHGLRHTYASLCAFLKIDIRVAMEWGGWTCYKTMNDIYTHVAKSTRKQNAEILREFFNFKSAAITNGKKITNEITNGNQKVMEIQGVCA